MEEGTLTQKLEQGEEIGRLSHTSRSSERAIKRAAHQEQIR